jgi:putative transposase
MPRHENQLYHKQLASLLFETVEYRCRQKIWFAHVFLLMPDHVHALLSFSSTTISMRKTISQWKPWTAKQFSICWQRDFFEHRLRNDENWREKADYILANPVRAGLAKKPEGNMFGFPNRNKWDARAARPYQ